MLVTCGVMSGSSTSHMTRTLSPPRIGSGNENTGCSTQSELLPGAWFVLEPSKPQIGSSLPSSRILVLDRSTRRRLGAVDPDVLGLVAHARLLIVRRAPAHQRCAGSPTSRCGSRPACSAVISRPLPGHERSVSGPIPACGHRTAAFLDCSHAAAARLRPAHRRGARRPLRPPLVHRRARHPEGLRDHARRARDGARGGHDLRRLGHRGLQPGPGIGHARPSRPEHVRDRAVARRRRPRRPHVLRHQAPVGGAVRGRPALRAEAQPRARPREGLHLLHRTRDGVLHLRVGRRPSDAARQRRLLRPHPAATW